MSIPRKIPPTTISSIEIEAAADAMKATNDAAEAQGEGGVSWLYLAQVALEAARLVCGGPSNTSDSMQ